MIKEYVNIGLNIETFIHLTAIVIGFVGLIFFLRIDWKRYGGLFLLASLVGNALCYIFVSFNFYSYPYRIFPELSIMPFTTITFFFPFIVLIAVRYSPEKWPWKIPFYWTIIHVSLVCETFALNETRIIAYNYEWDLWDSYTWWWIFLLLFEWIGGLLIPNHLRNPLGTHHLRFGKLGWGIIHFVLIVTIFLGGYYLGSLQR